MRCGKRAAKNKKKAVGDMRGGSKFICAGERMGNAVLSQFRHFGARRRRESGIWAQAQSFAAELIIGHALRVDSLAASGMTMSYVPQL